MSTSTKDFSLIWTSQPTKKFPNRGRAWKRRKRKSPEELWKCTPRSLARVCAGSAYANEHVHTPGVNNDSPVLGERGLYTRWTAFEYGSEEDLKKVIHHLKSVLTLEKFPSTLQQRSLIVPKAYGKIITELYRTKKKFMSGIPVYIGKCALYADFGLDQNDLRSSEVSAALSNLYYATKMPWNGISGREKLAMSPNFVYAKRYDALLRARSKKAQVVIDQGQ